MPTRENKTSIGISKDVKGKLLEFGKAHMKEFDGGSWDDLMLYLIRKLDKQKV